MSDLLLRPAGLPDVDLLAEWNERLILDQGHRNPMRAPQLHTRMAGWISGGEYQAWLFESADTPVGYGLTRLEEDFVFLRQFYIDREFRRKGLGKQALDLLCKQVKGQGRRMRVEVLVDNGAGIEFWRACQFQDYSVTLEKDL